jgi:stage II sporulation protein GA (sporulation sigma-E factor processing peptidase)
MVVYLDLAVFVNTLADGLALFVTARVSGRSVRWRRLLLAALLGGVYGGACQLPGLALLGALPVQLAVAAGLTLLGLGRDQAFLRYLLLFWLISCALAGAALTMAGAELNWGAFFLAGVGCYLLLSVIFRGGARHAVSGQLRRGWVELGGQRAEFTALLDTGSTLTHGGEPVLVVEQSQLSPLWTEGEGEALHNLAGRGAAACLADLSADVCRFRLLPYRAVGVSEGLLLCFRSDRGTLAGRDLGPVTVAISPTPVSDTGGYNALWGGEEGENEA